MKFYRKNLLLIFSMLLVLLCSDILLAQKPFTRKISYLDGLPTDVIYDLFVDRSGLLYLGTDKSLITYDGVQFNKLPIPGSLGNSISSIQQDASGRIWCRNFSNQLFYLANDKLNVDLKVASVLKTTNTNLVDFSVASNGLYILTQNSVYRYESGNIKRIFKVKNNATIQFSAMATNPKMDMLYVSSGNYLFTFYKDKLMETKYFGFAHKILEVFDNEVAFCTKAAGTTCMVKGKQVDLQKSGLANTFLNRLSATKSNLWLCTNKGVYEFDTREEVFKNGLLLDSRITDVVLDAEGNHWISTLDEGLFLLPHRQIFELTISPSQKSMFTAINTGPNGNYFAGTNLGKVNEISKFGKIVREYNTTWDNTIEFVNFSGDTLLTNYGFFKIGTSSPSSHKDYVGKNLEEDDSGNFLMASPSFGGLVTKRFVGRPNFPNSKNKFEIAGYGTNTTEVLIFRNKRTRSVLFEPKNREYYYGFVDGLYVYDRAGNEFQIKTNKNQTIAAAELLLNADGTIWAATTQSGLYLIKDKKCILRISKENGLSSNNCRKIAADKEGLWIITENGFDYYNYKTKRVTNAELNLCTKGITINDVVSLNEMIILATNRGIYYFDKDIINQVVEPKLSLTDFLVNNYKVNLRNNVTLDYDQNNVKIGFKTIQFKSLGNYRYHYRLQGLDNKWQSVDSKTRDINFLALKPGTYKFQLKIEIGGKFTPFKEINFKILKPFWLQIWFLTIVIFALLTLLYAVYRWAELKTKKSEELKEQLALSQLTALRSQMNPHFIFNVLNAVQGLIYSNQKSKASDYLGKFSDLMRKILDTSDKNEVTIEKEFETIDLYISLEKARFDNDFEYIITFPTDIDLSTHTIPSMIIQPFVENAIKHGLMHKKGLKILEIRAELLGDVWCFTIDDNGIGRKASESINQKIQKHISFAIKAIDNRVKLINKISDISIDIEVIDKKSADNQSLGTRIKIYIPIVKKF